MATIQSINVGAAPNDGNGDPARTGGQKINANFSALNAESLGKTNLVATTNPGSGNDNTEGYSVGSTWINTSTDISFQCVDAATGAAVWKETTQQDTNATNLGYTAAAAQGTVTSSTGNDATIPLATSAGASNEAGLASPAQVDSITANNAKVSNATHTGDATGDTALTIANDAVTLAKMQNASASSKLVGSGDSGAGVDYVEVTLGTGLSMSGTTLNSAGATDLGYTASATGGTVTSSTGNNATLPLVTPTSGSNEAGLLDPGDKDKLDSTSGTNTGDQTITLTGGVTGSGAGSFAATVITNANLTGGVTSVGNAATVVTNANLTGDVTSVGNASTIATGAVTNAKAADMANGTVKARTTAGSGDPEDIDIDTTFKSALNLASSDVGLGNVTNDAQVTKATYDANTILAATADDTPVALTVGASTFVGRKSTGNISSMSVTEAKTELGAGAVSGLATLDGSTAVPNAQVSSGSVTQHVGSIDHDSLLNYAVGQHRVINDATPSTTSLFSGTEIESRLTALANTAPRKEEVQTSTEGLGNITLSGEQTLNGVTTVTDRALVTEQTDAKTNGIYVTAAGAWARSTDFNEDADLTSGAMVLVNNASSTVDGRCYVLLNSPVDLGVDSVLFNVMPNLNLGTTAGTACEGNDSRLPTQDENNALVGTGTPSTSNKYVTEDNTGLVANLSNGTATGTTLDINSSTGTNVTIPEAIASGNAGLISGANQNKLDGAAVTSGDLSQFAATTSAQLAGVLSDETGSGAAVFSNSPTLVTPALGTPASGVATNITGTAASLTAGNVTTNANLTGGVTSVGNAATVVTNANLTGDVTSVGNAATIPDDTITLAKMAASTKGDIISYDASGDPLVLGVGTNNQFPKANSSEATGIEWVDGGLQTSYVGTFDATTDWGASSGGFYTITITAATHGKGTNVQDVSFQEDITGSHEGGILVDRWKMLDSNGDIEFRVNDATESSANGRFAGKVFIHGIDVGSGDGYATIQEEGSPLNQRANVNFIGNNVTAVDNPGSSRTDITVGNSVQFLAYNSTLRTNVTGAGTDYTVIFNTEVYDDGTDYNNATGVFTAPVAGIYIFVSNVRIEDVTASETQAFCRFVHNSQDYRFAQYDPGAVGVPGFGSSDFSIMNGSIILKMAASDTISVIVQCAGGTDVVDVSQGQDRTWISGKLLG